MKTRSDGATAAPTGRRLAARTRACSPLVCLLIMAALPALAELGRDWTQVTAPGWPAVSDSVVFHDQMLIEQRVDETDSVTWSSSDGFNWSTSPPHAYLGRLLVYEDKLWSMNWTDLSSSPDGVNWTLEGPAVPGGYSFSSEAVFDNRIWVLGGVVDLGEEGYCYASGGWWWPAEGNTWGTDSVCAVCPGGVPEPIAPICDSLWSRRYGHSSVVFDGKLWVIGGSGGYGYNLNDAWYTQDGQHWTQATGAAPWEGRICHASAVAGSRTWVMGGWTYDAHNNSTWFNDVWYSSSYDGVNWT